MRHLITWNQLRDRLLFNSCICLYIEIAKTPREYQEYMAKGLRNISDIVRWNRSSHIKDYGSWFTHRGDEWFNIYLLLKGLHEGRPMMLPPGDPEDLNKTAMHMGRLFISGYSTDKHRAPYKLLGEIDKVYPLVIEAMGPEPCESGESGLLHKVLGCKIGLCMCTYCGCDLDVPV